MTLEGSWEKKPGGRYTTWPVPHLTATLLVKDPRIELEIHFLIDTGADDVIIMARGDIGRLALAGLNIGALPPVDGIRGIGGTAKGYGLLNVDLTFQTRQGLTPPLPMDLVLILPGQPEGMPNVLGRSFLCRFVLLLDNRRELIRLTTGEDYTVPF